ncbi:hypothetical protein [Longispora albida]|nr:hypothetical protein [Longispora albida]
MTETTDLTEDEFETLDETEEQAEPTAPSVQAAADGPKPLSIDNGW